MGSPEGGPSPCAQVCFQHQKRSASINDEFSDIVHVFRKSYTNLLRSVLITLGSTAASLEIYLYLMAKSFTTFLSFPWYISAWLRLQISHITDAFLYCRFLEYFRPGYQFVLTAVAIRAIHATGNALVITSTFTYSAVEFQDNVGQIFVRISVFTEKILLPFHNFF